jgi:hypothetical protein
LLEAANTLAAIRKYRGQLVQLRAEAKERIGQLERLIVKVETRLQEGPSC